MGVQNLASAIVSMLALLIVCEPALARSDTCAAADFHELDFWIGAEPIDSATVNTLPPDVGPQGSRTPDFSGIWQLDKMTSRIVAAEGLAGLGEGGAPESLYVTQAANGTLIISSAFNGGQARAYQLGGESTVLVGPTDTMKVSSQWQESTLVTEGHRFGDDATAITGIKEVLALSDDGLALTLEVTTTTPSGAETNILVYERVL